MKTIALTTCEFRNLRETDIPAIVASFATIGWYKPSTLFQKYYEEQQSGSRCVWAAFKENVFLGYVTLKWQSSYSFFASQNIPEINDLNVLPEFRKQGIGSKLLDLAEAEAYKKSQSVGLGVGLYKDYGDAQKLYIKRGYIPDGCGVTYKDKPVLPGEIVAVDDDLVLWLIKQLRISGRS